MALWCKLTRPLDSLQHNSPDQMEISNSNTGNLAATLSWSILMTENRTKINGVTVSLVIADVHGKSAHRVPSRTHGKTQQIIVMIRDCRHQPLWHCRTETEPKSTLVIRKRWQGVVSVFFTGKWSHLNLAATITGQICKTRSLRRRSAAAYMAE